MQVFIKKFYKKLLHKTVPAVFFCRLGAEFCTRAITYFNIVQISELSFFVGIFFNTQDLGGDY